jgi:hypothetical protein
LSDPPTEQPISLTELDARHDDLLAQLEELDQRIQSVLKEHLPQKAAATSLAPEGNEPATTIPLPAAMPKEAQTPADQERRLAG